MSVSKATVADLSEEISDYSTDHPISGLSRTGREWAFAAFSEKNVLFLRQKYGVSERVARLAAVRLTSLEEADSLFFSLLRLQMPDPSVLPDVDKAYVQVLSILKEKRPVAVWGDYDVDGACSSALMVRYLRWFGIEVTPYVPDRFQEGYGPNQQGLELLFKKGIRDVFIVDCGTTSLVPLAWAVEQGMSVTVIDHHRVGPIHPSCLALINPKRQDYTGPLFLQQLCAGGLVFVFLVGVSRYLREKGFFEQEALKEPPLFSYLDLVALSTICDMMPLRHINRAFVKQGLKVMRQRKNIGLTSLIDASGIRESPDSIHLGYTVGPRINAGGRIRDASLGVRLLSCEDPIEALSMAQELSTLNQERQLIERQISEEAEVQALSQKDRPYLFVFGENWHEGVSGIIASHLKGNYYKPSFVLTVKQGFLKGSVRSIPGIDMGELLHHACEKGLLLSGGGHPMAGGLTLERAKLEAFIAFLDAFFQDHKGEEAHPPLLIDMALTFENLKDPDFFDDLEVLGPFGADYPHPRFLISGVRLEHILPFGYNHLRMYGVQSNGQRANIVYFRQADKDIGRWLLSHPACIIDGVFTIQTDRRWGYRRAHLMLEDLR
jgi:single-stranded-DNA-specific exonuclease